MARVIKSGTACYAEGGPVHGKVSEFLKTDNQFTTGRGVPQTYGKGGRGNPGQAAGAPNPAPHGKACKCPQCA